MDSGAFIFFPHSYLLYPKIPARRGISRETSLNRKLSEGFTFPSGGLIFSRTRLSMTSLFNKEEERAGRGLIFQGRVV